VSADVVCVNIFGDIYGLSIACCRVMLLLENITSGADLEVINDTEFSWSSAVTPTDLICSGILPAKLGNVINDEIKAQNVD
jgi:hypothetical protein